MKKSKNPLLKLILLFTLYPLLSTLLCGCATYKFHHGKAPYDKGYVVSRDGYTIPEYTLGEDNTVPEDLNLAKERFSRRRKIVEHYCKKMGYIENRFKANFWNPPIYALKFIGGIFRLPFIAISDYRYEHNPKYREKIRKIEEEKEMQEEARNAKLKEELNLYIQQTLSKENP